MAIFYRYGFGFPVYQAVEVRFLFSPSRSWRFPEASGEDLREIH